MLRLRGDPAAGRLLKTSNNKPNIHMGSPCSHLALEHARPAAADQLHDGVVGAEAEEAALPGQDAPHVVPHVAEVQILLRHGEVRL